MRPEGRIVYEAEINPIFGRKEILAYALGGGKVRNWAPAGEWVSAFRLCLVYLSVATITGAVLFMSLATKPSKVICPEQQSGSRGQVQGAGAQQGICTGAERKSAKETRDPQKSGFQNLAAKDLHPLSFPPPLPSTHPLT